MHEQEIRELLEGEYASALSNGDLDRYIALYDDDVIWSIPNTPDATDKEGIRALLGRVLSKVDQRVEVTVDEISIVGEDAVVMASARGVATPHGTADERPFALRVMWMLRRREDGWLIRRQVGTLRPAGTLREQDAPQHPRLRFIAVRWDSIKGPVVGEAAGVIEMGPFHVHGSERHIILGLRCADTDCVHHAPLEVHAGGIKGNPLSRPTVGVGAVSLPDHAGVGAVQNKFLPLALEGQDQLGALPVNVLRFN